MDIKNPTTHCIGFLAHPVDKYSSIVVFEYFTKLVTELQMCLTKCLLFKVYFSFYVQTSNIDGLEYIPYTFLTSSSFIIV